MKKIFKVLVVLLVVLGIASLALVFTGNQHIFKAVASTYLVGRTGPSIWDYKFFEHKELPNNTSVISWIKGQSKTLSQEHLTTIESYNPAAFLVIENGQIIYENYWGDGAVDSKSNSFSMAKSLTALAVGCAITDGLITSVNDPVSKYLDGWNDGLAKDLTIYHLLTMTSNINYDESYGNPFGYMAKVYYGNDVRELSKPYKVVEKPGTSWEYLGGNTLLLAQIVEKVTGKNLSDYFAERIWTPLATEQPAYWTIDEKGIEKAYCCFYSNARDFAKFGQLLLNFGNWNGKQLIDSTFINDAIKPAELNDGSTKNTYGYQIWLTNYQNMDMYFLRGILGQYVLVVPEKNLIIVRLGEGRSDIKINDHPKDVYQYIDAGLSLIN